jgi:hypothetical protein
MYKLLIICIMFLLGFYFIYRSNDIETFTDNSDDYHKDYKISEKCPDVLIQKGSAFFLYNSKRANIPGVNPIRFENLEEYVEFTEWQRSQGVLCPVLYLQHAYNAQGEPVYKARPSPTNLQGGQPDYVITPASFSANSALAMNPAIATNPTLAMNPEYMSNSFPNVMPPPANVPIQGLCDQNRFNPVNTPYGGSKIIDTNAYPGFDAKNQMIGCNGPIDKMFNQTSGVSPNPMDHNWGGIEFTENLVKSGYYKGNEGGIGVA